MLQMPKVQYTKTEARAIHTGGLIHSLIGLIIEPLAPLVYYKTPVTRRGKAP